jgi:hypothetical protein
MAKTRHQSEPSSNKTAMLAMAAGGVLVAALVVWALTRTVEPAAEPALADFTGTTASAPITPPTSTQPGTSTSPAFSVPNATATAAPPPRPQGDRSEVPRIAVEDLRAKLNRNEVTIVDVRDANSFNTRRIPGAINIPFASVQTMLDQIPKDKPIVTYCT